MTQCALSLTLNVKVEWTNDVCLEFAPKRDETQLDPSSLSDAVYKLNPLFEVNATTPERFTIAMYKLTLDELKQVAHQPDQLIVSCTFESISMHHPQCQELIRKGGSGLILSPGKGLCYTFNFGSAALSFFPGKVQGLELVFSLDRESAIS